MFSAPTTASAAAGHAALVAGAFLLFGYLIVDRLAGNRDLHWTARWGLAFPAVVAFTLVLMALHLLSGGAIFSRAPLVRALTLLSALGLLAVRWREGRRATTARRVEVGAVIAAAALGLVLWGWPVTQSLPLPNNADVRLHMGWAGQLLNGEAVPSAPITGDIPNYYPWMYHALVAFLAAFTPGGRAFHALGPLLVLQVTGLVLVLFALGRQLTGRWPAGAAAALFGALMGGVGYVLASGPDVVRPRAEEGGPALDYLGDLVVVRSYSFPFQNLAPSVPRNLSFSLLVGFLLLLAVGLQRKNVYALAGGGLVLGAVGLAGAEAFFVGAVIAVAAILFPGGLGRLKAALALVVPAAAVYALWLVPIAFNYARLGGFVNLTRIEPVVLPPHAVLVAWGVATPFAVYAGIRWLRGHGREEMGIVLVVVAAAATMLLLAGAVPRLLGDPFQTLGRHHRYWPLVHLGIVLAGALGASHLLERAWLVNRSLAVALAALITAVAIPSPLLASVALADRFPPHPHLAAALQGRPGAFLNVLSPSPGQQCTAAAGHRYYFLAFSYTGYRLVRFVWTPAHAGLHNAARVRWRDVYDYVPGDAEREAANRVLTGGRADPELWKQTARAWGVDVALVPLRRAHPRLLAEVPHEVAEGVADRVVVLGRDCRGPAHRVTDPFTGSGSPCTSCPARVGRSALARPHPHRHRHPRAGCAAATCRDRGRSTHGT